MGLKKPLLLVNNKRLIDLAISRIQHLFKRVIVVVKEGMDAILPYETVFDHFEDFSPLFGIYEGLRHSDEKFNFVLACDMPFANPDLVSYMLKRAEEEDAHVVVPAYRGFFEPLFACYSKECLSNIEKAIESHNLKVTSFYRGLKVVELREDEVRKFDEKFLSFTNINTREDLERILLDG